MQQNPENYTYDVTPSEASANATATPNNNALNGYAGAVFMIGDNQTTVTVLCESDSPGDTPGLITSGSEADVSCPGGSEQVK